MVLENVARARLGVLAFIRGRKTLFPEVPSSMVLEPGGPGGLQQGSVLWKRSLAQSRPKRSHLLNHGSGWQGLQTNFGCQRVERTHSIFAASPPGALPL